MEISKAMIEKLANLARLEFDEDAKASLQTDLQRMISFVDQLNEVDTTGVEPLLHMSPEINVLRDDEVNNELTREEGLKNAALKDGEFFKVPKVMR
jgi:aspartyl-tRNA(Asn)/glutamyl-tRNA(Gln) amidotransferase subunit C